jgi:hypothetical protein
VRETVLVLLSRKASDTTSTPAVLQQQNEREQRMVIDWVMAEGPRFKSEGGFFNNRKAESPFSTAASNVTDRTAYVRSTLNEIAS